MNAELFSEAMSEIDARYILEAVTEQKQKPFRLGWWRLHRAAACFAAVLLAAAVSLGTAFAVNADFRQAAISLLFPAYTEHQLHEIEEGHRTGSFDMEDTLFTFLEAFNCENMADDLTVKKENGFQYVVLSNDENSAQVMVECTTPGDKLLVVMERRDYQETAGLWQVTAYQILEGEMADEMMDQR